MYSGFHFVQSLKFENPHQLFWQLWNRKQPHILWQQTHPLPLYDLFVYDKLITFLTTKHSEMETICSNRIRSIMRKIFNLIAFNIVSDDK